MPLTLASSVEVASTDRAQRRHRRTCTETTGRWMESMLCRTEVLDDEADRSESEAEYDELEEELR
jgi:hypothetical protein